MRNARMSVMNHRSYGNTRGVIALWFSRSSPLSRFGSHVLPCILDFEIKSTFDTQILYFKK